MFTEMLTIDTEQGDSLQMTVDTSNYVCLYVNGCENVDLRRDHVKAVVRYLVAYLADGERR